MASSSGIQLCLLSNDPTSTLLMTPEGQTLYSITTPVEVEHTKPEADNSPDPDVSPLPDQSTEPIHPVVRSHSHRRKALKSRTTINRLDHLNPSSGHVETTVGIIAYPNSTSDFDPLEQPEVALDLCEQKCVLTIEAAPFASGITHIARVEGREQAPATKGEPQRGEAESSDEEWVLVTEKNTSKTLQKKANVEERYE